MHLFLIILTVALVGMTKAEAACSGGGTSWSCTAGSSSIDIQTAVSMANDGATITFLPGSYTLSTFVQLIPGKGVTLICATTPLKTGAAVTDGCTLNIGTINGPVFGSLKFDNTTYTQCYRLSGFIIDGMGTYRSSYGSPFHFDNANKPAGTHTVITCIRLDHNTFRNFPADQKVGLRVGHSASPFNTGNYYGVVDHNVWTSTSNVLALFYEGAINFNPPPAQAGTGSNIFFEDNLLTIETMSGNGLPCTDGWGGVAYVVRFNTSTNCSWGGHGEKHEGGFANYEFYGNRVLLDNGASGAGFFQDCSWCFHAQGSGEMLIFNNSFYATLGKGVSVIVTQDYRSSSAGDANSYTPDLGAPLPVCDGTVVSFSGKVTDGNRTPIEQHRGYPCWRQAGRDYHRVLKPIYVWNNFWEDTLTKAGFRIHDQGGTPNYLTNHLQANRDYYEAISASMQTSPTNPFNGISGLGFGTLANRPTSCTPTSEPADAGDGGVGYWASDVGSWKTGPHSQGQWPGSNSGILYTCSSTNTWTTHYTPYIYPHPLTTSGTSGNFSSLPPPTNLTVR